MINTLYGEADTEAALEAWRSKCEAGAVPASDIKVENRTDLRDFLRANKAVTKPCTESS